MISMFLLGTFVVLGLQLLNQDKQMQGQQEGDLLST